MAFGPPIELAMEVPQFVPSPFRPELKALKELPTSKDATTETIRLEGTLAKRLPPITQEVQFEGLVLSQMHVND